MTGGIGKIDYGKVAVLLGGTSAEREISLQTGHAIHDALCAMGVDAHCIDTRDVSVMALTEQNFDRAFIALHGRGGEDGVIQGALDSMDIPYTGSGVLGSALAMDKVRTKLVWQGLGINTARFVEVRQQQDIERVAEELEFPVMVKPVQEGSSCGASKVKNVKELESAWEIARQYDARVMVENWIVGKEYTVAILLDETLPLIRLETPHEFYDYEAKYLEETTLYHCPCGLTAEQEKTFQALALTAFKAVAATGWGRVDFIVDEQGEPSLIEVNTIPGMTSHSLVPMAARHAGIDFNDLVMRILQTSLNRNREVVKS